MRTRVLMLGIAFVLLTTIPIQADPAASYAADYPQFSTETRQQYQSAMRAIGGLLRHTSTLSPIVQDHTSITRRLLPQLW
jgi:hypothetical protein